MKKIISYIMLGFLCVVLFGCNKPNETQSTGNQESNTTIPSETSTTATSGTTEVTLNTSFTDELKLEKDFVGKSFLNDRIGEVRLERVVDGDTIRVYEGKQLLTIRFLNVNTPESTGNIDPWGKAASAFAKETLGNCASIVLECDGTNDRVDSTLKRYLALVWYKKTANDEYRLFNLEEVELAYSQYTYNEKSDYHSIFMQAEKKTQPSNLKVWGQKDPNYNYSRETVETSLLYLLSHHDTFQTGTKFIINIRIVRTVGNNMFLEDAEEESYENEDGDLVIGKGSIYAFYGYSISYYKSYKIGDAFTITCQLEWQGDYGTQLTGLAMPSNVISNVTPVIQTVDAEEMHGGEDFEEYYGRVIKVKNLTVNQIKDKTTAAGDKYNVVVCTNSRGEKFDIYFSQDLMNPYKVHEVFTVGETYNITGGVASYEYANGGYQLAMGDAPKYRKGELLEGEIHRLYDIIKASEDTNN